MIKVNLYKNSEDYIGKYNVSGHAGYASKGQDIVCAAVSVLAQTTLMSLIEVCGIDEEEIKYAIDDEKGILDVSIPKTIDSDIRNKVQIVLKTFELGIKSIIESYPGYVTLEYREV